MPNSFNIPADGIIGKDFIKYHECILGYRKKICSFELNNRLVSIPILDSPTDDVLVLPARAEVFRTFYLPKYNQPQFINNFEISPGIFVANSIGDSQYPILKVINTTNEIKNIPKSITKSENLSNFNIYSMNKIKAIPERNKILTKLFEKNSPKHCDNTPVYTKNYRLPHSQKAEISKQVQKLRDDGLIETSKSPYNSPLILVPKKSTDGSKKWRMCIDYRQLNRKLIADKFPLPRIDEILDSLGRAKFFSCLDLFSGFHQIKLEKDSRELTAFTTEAGTF